MLEWLARMYGARGALSFEKGSRGGGRTQVVGGHDDAVFELDGDDGGARHDGGLCCGLGAAGLEVGGIVSAVDVVSGLQQCQFNRDGSGEERR